MTKPLPPLSKIERLLIVKTSSIGDVVHALPVVEAIRKANPHLSIGWVVRKRCAEVLRGNPWIDRVHVFENEPSLGELFRLRAELRVQNYQAALDMQGLWLSGLVACLSGAPVRIGLDRNREFNSLFMTHAIVPGKVGESAGDRHAVDILYGFAEAFGIREVHRDFEAQPYLAETEAAELLERVNSLPGPRIALNVGASWKYKQWPVEHWAALADLLGRQGLDVVFVGDNTDALTVADIKAAMQSADRTVDLSGKTGLRQLAAVLAACDIVITADTGPMHLAVAVGAPVVALFGATNPQRTGPYGARNLVLDQHIACSPCYRHPTCAGRVDCMRQITPQEVLTAVEQKLGRPGRPLASQGLPSASQ